MSTVTDQVRLAAAGCGGWCASSGHQSPGWALGDGHDPARESAVRSAPHRAGGRRSRTGGSPAAGVV